MARFDTTGLNEVLREMERMNMMTGDVAKAMIKAGAEEAKVAWVTVAAGHGYRRSGDMMDSIGYPKEPKNLGNALSLDIYPQGKDHKGVRNAEKAFILHYGTSKLKGSRWVDEVGELTELTAVDQMANVFYEFIETGKVKEVATLVQPRRR